MTVNTDRFAATSYSTLNPGARFNEFEGFSINENFRLLRSPDKYIINMHGNIDKPKTWVFTREELSGLQKVEGYSEFLTAIFSINTVLFIGVSADDVAVGGILENMINKKIDLSNHYWITDRNDNATIKWANSSHVNIIKYSYGKHNEVSEYIDDITKYISKDIDLDPVIYSANSKETITHDELIGKIPNESRTLLNSYAAKLLKENTETNYKSYFDFLEDFDPEIHNAWCIGLRSPYNSVLGYTIKKQIGSGNFGTVYEAEKDGNTYAIKVLHPEIRNQNEKLKSFRRGVRSLTILSQRSIAGIVKSYEATEIPAMIVMDYINGVNLKNFVEMGFCDNWETILDISEKLCKIIVSAHSIPERVLHRDLKPSNIIFDNYFEDSSIKLVITDFDFAWYKDAIEGDIPRNPTGYIAPEQVDNVIKDYARSSLVDSYSIGMILYYMVSKKDPLFKSHLMKSWNSDVLESCKLIKSKNFESLRIRFSRLINSLTIDQQINRLTITDALFEIERLIACNNSCINSYVELLTEELMYKIVGSENYEIHKYTYKHVFASGITINLTFSETRNEIVMNFIYTLRGQESHKNVRKYLPDKYEKINRQLINTGWQVDITTASSIGLVLNAIIKSDVLYKRFDEITTMLNEFKHEFDFI